MALRPYRRIDSRKEWISGDPGGYFDKYPPFEGYQSDPLSLTRTD